jgi:hypothetical protein
LAALFSRDDPAAMSLPHGVAMADPVDALRQDD